MQGTFADHKQFWQCNLRKINLHGNGDDQWISLHMQVHTPWDKCPIDDYSQWSLALLIPGSRVNTRNSPGTCPYCNRQPLKKFPNQMKPRKFNTTKFSPDLFLTWKFSNLRYNLQYSYEMEELKTHLLSVARELCCSRWDDSFNLLQQDSLRLVAILCSLRLHQQKHHPVRECEGRVKLHQHIS